MSEPKRLLEGGDAPKALHDALSALRAQGPSPAVSARIAARIAAPSPPKPALGPRIGAAIGLVALSAVVAWQAWPVAQRAHVPVERTSAAPSAAEHVVERAEPARAEPARVAPMITAPTAPQAEESRTVVDAMPLEATGAPAQDEVQTPAKPRAARAPARSVAPRPPPAAPTQAVAASATVAAQEEPPAELAAAPATVDATERQFADPQDEASLLYRARRLASSDPRAALRLIVLHEASFPNGSFSEERDMLEIQIHERLGDRALAQRLAAQFRARYPGSVYRAGEN